MAYALGQLIWLEGVNYLEHYGLRREKDENGVYESIGYQHSWSAASSPMAFRIQRHSDHHAHSYRPYQILRRFDKTPTLPFEYFLMFQMALVPPLFFKVMDPRVDAISDAKKDRANLNAWNRAMPLSELDKKNLSWAHAYFVFMAFLFTICMLNNFQ